MSADATGKDGYQRALDTAERLLGRPLVLPLGDGELPAGEDFRSGLARKTATPQVFDAPR